MAKPITDRPIYTFTRYVYYFFIINLYFFLSNILFFIVFYAAEFVFENILLFYVTLIPMGPSIVAVLATMGKLICEGEVNPTSEYFKTYKMNVLPALKYWLIQLTIMLILSVDIFYSVNRSNIFSPLFLILLIVCLFIMSYAFPIIARFEVKIKNVFTIAIYANFKFPKTTLLNITTIVAFGFIYYHVPGLSTLFIVSLTGFFLMYNLQQPFAYMEAEMSQTEQGEES